MARVCRAGIENSSPVTGVYADMPAGSDRIAVQVHAGQILAGLVAPATESHGKDVKCTWGRGNAVGLLACQSQ